MPVEALRGFGEQLRCGVQVPVGVGRFDVPEVGREQREPGRDVAAIAVPVQQGRDRETVALMRNSS
ncbi:MAG: hypothetical protein ACRDTA_02650 [Pseudonocardiaceae bacterium]